MIWRTRLTVIGAITLALLAVALSSNGKGATAAPLRQFPPTSTPESSTPVPPTDTPVSPTDTPVPIATSIPPTLAPFATVTPAGPTPVSGTPTSVSATRVPRRGSGGGAPPGPSGTPTVNGCVKSIGKNGISLSTDPGFYQPHVQIIPRDHVALVLAGPQRADTIWWWRLRTDAGVEGWGNQDEMTPDPGPCAFGVSSTTGGQTPPYPITIVPAFSAQVTAVSPATPLPAAPTAAPQTTPAQQAALPQTGDGSLGLWFLVGLLVITVIVAGWMRRRPYAGADLPDEDDPDKSH